MAPLLAWVHALAVGDAMPCVCESPVCEATRLIPALATRQITKRPNMMLGALWATFAYVAAWLEEAYREQIMLGA